MGSKPNRSTSAADKKIRLDVLVVQQGHAETREKARALILAGKVLTGDRLLDKPGTKVDPEMPLRLRGVAEHYVSRGAYKLLAALREFGLRLEGKTCLDVGSSTGGFSQVCLEAGAAKVYAVDVGTNQLHWKLRSDTRVVSLERVNLRTAPSDLLPERADFACVDTSFISLKLILPAVIAFVRDGADVVALIKPQHEVGRENVGKGGIVKDPELHKMVTDGLSSFAQSRGFEVLGLIESPIKGSTGNTEFLIHLRTKSSR